MLIDAYPAAAAEKDPEGNLPLHHAVLRGACVEVVDMLLKAHPEAARECEMYIQCQRDYSEERKRKREFVDRQLGCSNTFHVAKKSRLDGVVDFVDFRPRLRGRRSPSGLGSPTQSAQHN